MMSHCLHNMGFEVKAKVLNTIGLWVNLVIYDEHVYMEKITTFFL